MATDTNTSQPASGVQDLVDKLRQEGVAAGQAQAEQLVAEARVKAMEILDEAKAQSEQIQARARTQAAEFEESGKEALRLASRDVILRVREACYDEFQNRLRRFVRHRLSDQKLLEQMILELAAKARPADSVREMRLLLPNTHISEEDLAKEVAEVEPGSLAAFVLGLTANILREGLHFAVSDDPETGVRIQIVEDDVQLELTERTITSVLMQYLAPRYQAVMKKED